MQYKKLLNMSATTTVSELMTKEVISVAHTASLSTVRQLLMTHHIRHLPVLSAGQVVGIISKSDFTRLTSGTFYATQQEADTAMMDMFTLEDIMIKNPVVISSELTIKDAADIFIAQDFHALPVVDNGQLTGILSVTDLLRHLRDTL